MRWIVLRVLIFVSRTGRKDSDANRLLVVRLNAGVTAPG
jgi:hypothetical protein